jgi:hypothetical protein
MPPRAAKSTAVTRSWRTLTALFWRHINPYGTFRLDTNKRLRPVSGIAPLVGAAGAVAALDAVPPIGDPRGPGRWFPIGPVA